MKIKTALLSLGIAGLLLAGCGDGGGGGNPVQKTDFTAFVKQLLANTSDTTEPAEINDLDFQFNEDEADFDDVLQ